MNLSIMVRKRMSTFALCALMMTELSCSLTVATWYAHEAS